MQQGKCFGMMEMRMIDILVREQGSLYRDWLDAWRQVVRRVQPQSVGERLRVLWFFSCSIGNVYRLALCRAARPAHAGDCRNNSGGSLVQSSGQISLGLHVCELADSLDRNKVVGPTSEGWCGHCRFLLGDYEGNRLILASIWCDRRSQCLQRLKNTSIRGRPIVASGS